jgi:tetratricopeptide (TPR) repeat protein
VIKAFQQAIRIKPEDAKTWYNLGVTYGDSGQTSQVMEFTKFSLQFKRTEPALEYMTSNKVALVISYIVLLGINGIEFFKRGKKNYPKIPFVIHTALHEYDRIIGSASLSSRGTCGNAMFPLIRGATHRWD